MAKGKYAARSELRQALAAQQHIDKLMTEVVDLRDRVRQYKPAALELPVVKEELVRQRRMNAEGTSDKLEQEREQHRKELDKADDTLDRFLQVFLAFVERQHERHGPGNVSFSTSELEELQRTVGITELMSLRYDFSRRGRRNMKSVDKIRMFLAPGNDANHRHAIEDNVADRLGLPMAEDNDKRLVNTENKLRGWIGLAD